MFSWVLFIFLHADGIFIFFRGEDCPLANFYTPMETKVLVATEQQGCVQRSHCREAYKCILGHYVCGLLFSFCFSLGLLRILFEVESAIMSLVSQSIQMSHYVRSETRAEIKERLGFKKRSGSGLERSVFASH